MRETKALGSMGRVKAREREREVKREGLRLSVVGDEWKKESKRD